MTAPLTPETLRRLETLVLPVPAAVQFADIAQARVVNDALAVTLAPLAAAADAARETARPRSLTRAGSGTYAAMTLPGIDLPPLMPADFAGDSGFMAQPQRPYRLRMDDAASRFLPIVARLALPAHDAAGWPGWAALDTAEPAGLRASARALLPPARWPLFSAPGRANPGALAEIRCNLRAADAGAPPPAWVLLGASHDGALIGLGLADANGAGVIFCPYPPLPGGAPIPPPGFAWNIRIHAWWGGLPRAPVPDLAAVLAQFALPARLYRQSGPLVILPLQPLRPGQPLLLRTQTAASNSDLLIRAA